MPPRPRVILVLDRTGADGTTRHVLELCRFFDLGQLQLHLVCLGRAGSLAIPFQHEDVPVHALEFPEADERRGPRFGITVLLTLFNLFRRLAPDVVHTFGYEVDAAARFAARLARVPWVVATHRRAEEGSGIGRFLRRRTANLADLVVVPTEALASDAVANLGIHPARLRTISPGVDLGRVAGVRPADLGAGTPKVGMVAHLTRRGGAETFVDAFGILARYHAGIAGHVIGAGPSALGALRRADQAGLLGALHFPGEASDLGPLLAALDVVVVPPHGTAAPQILVEALAAGRPVVASRVPGITDLVEHEVHALLVDPGHPALLADAIDRLLVDRALAARLAEAGRRLVQQRFLASSMAEAHRRLYASLLGLPEEVRAAQPEPAAAFEC